MFFKRFEREQQNERFSREKDTEMAKVQSSSGEERSGQRNNARRDAEINIATMCFWSDEMVLFWGRAERNSKFCFSEIGIIFILSEFRPALLWEICLEEIVVKQNQRKHDRSQDREKRKHPKDKITQLDDFRKGNILS